MKKFEIAFLKYRHSYDLQESINIGALILDEVNSNLYFIYPSKLKRLSDLYRDISLSTIKTYLKNLNHLVFEAKSKLHSINSESLLFSQHDGKARTSQLEAIISAYIIKEDSSSFYFTTPQVAIGNDFELLRTYYENKILDLYESKVTRDRKNEDYINKKIESKLNTKPLLKSEFKPIYIENAFFNEEFEYGWKNGKTNIITPISFDYSQSKSIDDKAYKTHGKIGSFKDVAIQKNYNFDLILAEPLDKKLFSEFKNALGFLETIEVPKRIFIDNQLEEYLDSAFIYLSK